MIRMRMTLVLLTALMITGIATAQPATAEGEVTLNVYPTVTKLENGNIASVLKKYTGDVVVLNIWATWCVPCIKEMPDLIKLRNEYTDKGVHLVLLSVDDVDKLETDVQPLLVQKGVNFETYIRTSGDEQEFINNIDESWSGAIPLTLIFDRKGNKNTIIFGSKHYDDFKGYVEPLL